MPFSASTNTNTTVATPVQGQTNRLFWRWWRKQSPSQQDRYATLGPLVSVLLFLAAIIAAFWYLRNEELEREQESVRRDTEVVQQQLRLRLVENQEQLLRLAREISLRQLYPVLVKSVISSSVIMFIIATAALFSWLLNRQGIPDQAAAWLVDVFDSPAMFLLGINLFLFVVGMFVETSASIIVLIVLRMRNMVPSIVQWRSCSFSDGSVTRESASRAYGGPSRRCC